MGCVMAFCAVLGFVSGLALLCKRWAHEAALRAPFYSSVKAGAVQQAHECPYIPPRLFLARLCRARVRHPLSARRAWPAQRTLHHLWHSIPHSSSAAACLPSGAELGSRIRAAPRQGPATSWPAPPWRPWGPSRPWPPGRRGPRPRAPPCRPCPLRRAWPARRGAPAAQRTRSCTRRHSCVCELGCRRSGFRARAQPRKRKFLGRCACPSLPWRAAQVEATQAPGEQRGALGACWGGMCHSHLGI
jgi:hypothetical protein